MPAEAAGQAYATQTFAAAAPVQTYTAAAPQQTYSVAAPTQTYAAAAPQAVLKAEVGGWCIAQGSSGELYYNRLTGQAFSQPPPELLALMQQQPQQVQYQPQYAAQ